ncbi:MAG TPA: GTP-binding protein, partial [Roseateles sp.]
LQEAADADLLLHVVDAASPVLDEQMVEVERVLEEIGAAGVPQILVYNKQDLLPDDQRPREIVDAVLRANGSTEPTPRVFVSAIDGSGLNELRQLIATAMLAQPLIPDERDPRFDAVESDFDPNSSDPSQA